MFKLSFIYIGSFCFILSLLSFFNIIYSYYFEILYNIEIYIYTLIISLIFASLFFVKKNELKKISIYEKIISVAAGYLILPLIISVPYYFGLSNLSFLNSYFESVSGFVFQHAFQPFLMARFRTRFRLRFRALGRTSRDIWPSPVGWDIRISTGYEAHAAASYSGVESYSPGSGDGGVPPLRWE